MTLYDIDTRIAAAFDENTGEILDIEALDKLEMERENKLRDIALACKNLKGAIEMIVSEKKNLEEKLRSTEKRLENAKNYLAYALAGQKLKTPIVSVSYRRSESVELDPAIDKDPWLLPDMYIRKKPEPDKTAIMEALKNGESIPGASIRTNMSVIVK